jgi:hypothetical protein
MATGERPKWYKVRRLVKYPEGSRFEFLRFNDEPGGRIDDTGEWVGLWEDGSMFPLSEAARMRQIERDTCINHNVVSHAIVPCQ